ncbi:MAG: alpha/beta hydrolase [Rhizobiales bacterium]|nr:alpha/beta hydrolase [Hyphomicrobiales bacterium]
MPHASARDGTKLYYEEAGSGTPILFVHEFAADYRSWEPQMRYFARSHRCITYSARGYTPSDVPPDLSAYTYEHFRDDVVAMLDHLSISKAHIVGLSMGGYATLQVGIAYPDRALSLTLAGTGSGSEQGATEEFRRNAAATAEQFWREGSRVVAKNYGAGPGRVPFEVKDPRGFREFAEWLGQHDARGSGNTMRMFQGERPPMHAFDEQIRKITLPTLIVCGDEDDPCIEPSLYLKSRIAASGLAMFPKSGHTVNLEEPALFNQTLAEFFLRVENGRWGARDPRSIRPAKA